MESLQSIEDSLPAGYRFRRLQLKDFKDVTETLKVLTTVGDIDESKFLKLLQCWDSIKVPSFGTADLETTGSYMYNPIVIVTPEDTVVATGMLLVEPKIIHECGLVGHIEDIAIDKTQQGKKFGIKLIKYLYTLAQQSGCYKVILDCSDTNVAFYEKCGLQKAGVEMQVRF